MAEAREWIHASTGTEPSAVTSASVPDHELLQLIGRGSYGEVWLARNTLGTFRAVKLVFADRFRNRRPFEREFNGVKKFEPISRLHDGLMDVLQVGRNDAAGYFYYVMELADDVVSGQAIDPGCYSPRTLASEIARCKRLPAVECRRIGISIASALDFLHGHALIHRDVKPSNIVFVNGTPRLADIGLVTEIATAESYVGTDGFIPPEGPGTAQADIYSLGKVLYEISTGNDRHDYPELPAELNEANPDGPLLECNPIVLKACRADPRQRYRSADAMLADLLALPGEARLLPEVARPVRTRTLIGAAAAAVGVISALILLLGHLFATTGVVGYWPGEDDAIDDVGGHDGEALGGLSYAPGQVGQAFLFDTPTATVRIPADPALDVGKSPGLTLEAWIRPDGFSRYEPLFEWNDGKKNRGAHFGVDPIWTTEDIRPGALAANLMDTEFNWHRISSPAGVVATNVFQHVALTYDKRTGVATIYCNGAVVAREKLGRFTALTGYDLYLGRRVSSEAADDVYVFKGRIDEPAIHNRALSPEEIQAAYRAGLDGRRRAPLSNAPAPAGIVAWWRAENSGVDLVGGNDAVLMPEAGFAPAKVGQGFKFTGSSDSYAVVPDSPSLRLTNELTIEFWFRRGEALGVDFVVNKGGDWDNNELNYSVGVAAARLKHMLVFSFAGGSRGAGCIDDFKWHHCAVTARHGDADPLFYIDGVRQPIIPPDGTNGAAKINLHPSTAPLLIGAQVDLVTERTHYSTAHVDELSLYSRVLSASELQTIFKAGRAGKTEPPGEASEVSSR